MLKVCDKTEYVPFLPSGGSSMPLLTLVTEKGESSV